MCMHLEKEFAKQVVTEFVSCDEVLLISHWTVDPVPESRERMGQGRGKNKK